MKRHILFAFLFLSVFSGYAKDIITKTDGTDINAKIYEVGLNEVKYKNFSEPDGPMYSIATSEILAISYENGENEVFNSSTQNTNNAAGIAIVPGMHYRDYKNVYNTREYVHQPGDQFNPFWIGFGDFFIPGLGNAILGEWGRAAGFFFGNAGLGIIGLTQVKYVETNNQKYVQVNPLYWVILAARVGLNVWSICDAVHVSKAKNMYNQDLRSKMSSMDMRLEPYFAYTPTSQTGLQPVTGLSLKLNF